VAVEVGIKVAVDGWAVLVGPAIQVRAAWGASLPAGGKYHNKAKAAAAVNNVPKSRAARMTPGVAKRRRLAKFMPNKDTLILGLICSQLMRKRIGEWGNLEEMTARIPRFIDSRSGRSLGTPLGMTQRISGKILSVAETKEKRLLNKRYQLEDFLEKGGMATVYRGRDLMLERDVAIKLLREDYSRDPAFRERFRQEAKAAANLSHSNIVTVYDFGFDAEHLFIVMEYVPGTNLSSLFKQRGRYSLEEGVPLIIQACKGLGYAHRAGLVHCDIKPHNFLVTPDKRLKVTDFGIARALASIHPDEEAEVVWGSPQYFSPEQASGSAPSPASDVYSLGVILYQMFTGKLPFDSKTAAELAKDHQFREPQAPVELNPKIPPSLNEIMLKVLSKEPSARYRTADQLGRVLLTFAASEKVAEVEAYSKPGDKRPTGPHLKPGASAQVALPTDWVSVGLGLLAALAVGGLLPFWMWVYLVFNPPIP